MEALFEGAVNVPAMLRMDIQKILPQGTVVRPAVHQGIEFNHCRPVDRLRRGNTLWKLRDDLAQLGYPGQERFETTGLSHQVALNVYPSVVKDGGDLELVNIRSHQATKRRFGIAHSGYPSPAETLEAFERLVVKPQAGDLLILAGSCCPRRARDPECRLPAALESLWRIHRSPDLHHRVLSDHTTAPNKGRATENP